MLYRLDAPIHDGDHLRGPRDAPLMLVEYGDYECPYCREADGVVRRLVAELGDDLCYVFRNYPLVDIHPNAMNAARAAEAAALQDRFWAMHDRLFEHQELDDESLLEDAAELGLDLERFLSDMSSRRVERRIVSDMHSGAHNGVHSTPTFFINGELYDGDWSYETLLMELRSRLRGTGQMAA